VELLLDSFSPRHFGWRSRCQGFAAESTDALEVIPAVTGGESSFQGLTEDTPVVGALFLRNYEIKGPTDRLACAVTGDVLGGLARE
jgi:hypothetical protein